MELLPYVFDLAGTFVFALSGAMAGVKRRLDVFGVLVLSFVAANTGGITRDILIGAVPPGAINDWHYLAVSLAAGVITFCFPSALIRSRNPVMAIALGALTGIGGGMARDLLLTEIPIVLRADLYAVAALAGATIVVMANVLQLPSVAA